MARARSPARWRASGRGRCCSAFSSDWLYPPSGSREIEEALRGLGRQVEHHVIDAPYGHDCFLLEEARQTPIVHRFLHQPS